MSTPTPKPRRSSSAARPAARSVAGARKNRAAGASASATASSSSSSRSDSGGAAARAPAPAPASALAPAPAPRRQARGEKRIAEILDAAGRVFAEVGYEQATTNAIAAAAGISPGSLYQFFANKEQIALRLAEHYAAQLREVHARAFDPALATLPLADAIDRMVDPFLTFHRQAVGFQALFVGSFVSPELEETVQRGVEAIFHARAPKVRDEDIRLNAWACVRLVKGFMPSAVSGSKTQQRQATQELKTILRRYVEPVIG